MRQISRLFYFEWKKIWKRKSTWITLGFLIIFHFVMESFYFLGSTYIEGEFLETHLEGIKIDQEHGHRLSGRKIDETLLQEMQEAYHTFSDEKDSKYMLTEDFQKIARPYRILSNTLNIMLWGLDLNIFTVTEQQLYENRTALMKQKWDTYKLTKAEKAYWEEKEKDLTKPFTYQYAESYDYLISMSGVYRISMLVTFLIAICISAVFTEEHGRKTDQLILCSRFGRTQLYFAKILAGSFHAFISTLFLMLIEMLFAFNIYGTDGFSAPIQLYAGTYPASFSIGQVFLIMTGILFLSSVLISTFTMVLSEITNSNIVPIAVVTAGMFAARLIPIPYQYRIFSQAWNYLPINLLKFDEGFQDMRLVSIFGIKLTAWQFSILLYSVLIIAIILAGKKRYCGYQVQGR